MLGEGPRVLPYTKSFQQILRYKKVCNKILFKK